MTSGTELAMQWLSVSPFVRHLGLEIENVEDGRAEIRMPFGESLPTIGDVVHGGAISSLIDTAATLAAWAGAEPPENMRGTTVDLSVSFLAAARGTDVTAVARVMRRGKNLAFVEVDATDADGRVVAKGLVTYKIG